MAQDISSFLIISSTSSMDWSGFVSSFAREVYNKTDKKLLATKSILFVIRKYIHHKYVDVGKLFLRFVLAS